MTLGLLTDTERETFDCLCALAPKRSPRRVTLSQVGDAGVLARELHRKEPDRVRVERFCRRLGLDPREVAP